jgi:hypothetical protein
LEYYAIRLQFTNTITNIKENSENINHEMEKIKAKIEITKIVAVKIIWILMEL